MLTHKINNLKEPNIVVDKCNNDDYEYDSSQSVNRSETHTNRSQHVLKSSQTEINCMKPEANYQRSQAFGSQGFGSQAFGSQAFGSQGFGSQAQANCWQAEANHYRHEPYRSLGQVNCWQAQSNNFRYQVCGSPAKEQENRYRSQVPRQQQQNNDAFFMDHHLQYNQPFNLTQFTKSSKEFLRLLKESSSIPNFATNLMLKYFTIDELTNPNSNVMGRYARGKNNCKNVLKPLDPFRMDYIYDAVENAVNSTKEKDSVKVVWTKCIKAMSKKMSHLKITHGSSHRISVGNSGSYGGDKKDNQIDTVGAYEFEDSIIGDNAADIVS